MNLHDSEWVPEPSDPTLLRKVQVGVKAAASPHDVANLRTMLRIELKGAIPHEARGHVWMSLLGLRAEDLTAENPTDFARVAREAVSERNSKDQIWKDVERTRPALKRFQQPAVRGALLRLLSLFCARRSVQYIQGLNELLAPFVLLADTGGNPRFVYALFGAFVSRFAPWMLDTSEAEVFGVLKRAFKYFGRLLLYHDPELFWLLERNGMTPDLYATSWFVTLFARNFSVEAVLALWDLLLLEDNPLGPYFFALALLLSKRDVLVNTDPSLLPETLMVLTAHSADEVRKLWSLGEKLRSDATPPSYQRLMNDRLVRPAGRPSPTAISAARSMQASACLQTTPDDLFAAAGGVHYFSWDCRTKEEFAAGHLAASVYLRLEALRACGGHVGPAVLTDAARRELTAAVALCEPLRGKSHICLVGSGDKEEDDTDINPLALYLTEVGIPYVSTLRGGFAAAVASAEVDGAISGVELVDYEPELHRQSRLDRQQKRTLQAESAAVSASGENGAGRRRSSQGSGCVGSGEVDSSGPTGVASDIRGFGLHAMGASSATPEARPKPDSGDAAAGVGLSGADSEVAAAAAPNFRISSFFEKTDAEVSRGGLASGELSSASMDAGMNKSSGSSLGALVSPDALSRQSASCAGSVSREATPSRSSSARSTVATIRRGLFGSMGGGGSSSPSVTPTDGASVSGAGGADSSARAKWRREAWAGWLDNSTLSLAAMPKDFVVDSSDTAISTGLRLFPCRARSETSLALTRGRNKVGGSSAGGGGSSAGDASSAASGEFKRRFLGVSTRYIMLLSPHGLRSHLLKVKLIRHLHDIVRITFKRSRPELVTFELLSATDPSAPNEQVVCIMPDGLSDCVELIKDALADSESVQPTTSMAGTPLTGMGLGSPRNESLPVSGVVSPTAAVEGGAARAAASPTVIGAGDVGVGKASGRGSQAPFGIDKPNSGTRDAEAQVPQPSARDVVERLGFEPTPP
ncbi:hypothetical protein MMPV_005070 [Pyropia vietnamensis]